MADLDVPATAVEHARERIHRREAREALDEVGGADRERRLGRQQADDRAAAVGGRVLGPADHQDPHGSPCPQHRLEQLGRGAAVLVPQRLVEPRQALDVGDEPWLSGLEG